MHKTLSEYNYTSLCFWHLRDLYSISFWCFGSDKIVEDCRQKSVLLLGVMHFLFWTLSSTLILLCFFSWLFVLGSKQEKIWLSCCFQLRPRLSVSGYFWVRNFFFPDSYIFPSTRSVLKSKSPVHTHPMVSGLTLEKLIPPWCWFVTR